MKVNIPTGWHQVTIRQYSELKNLAESHKELDIDYVVKQIAILADVREEVARAMPLDKAKEVASKISFITTDISGKAKAKFKVGGKTYRPVLDLSKMDAGPYIDLVTYAKDPEENMHEVLALMTTGKDTQEERAHNFYHHLTMNIAHPLMVFFYTSWNHFITNTHHSSMKRILKTMKEQSEKLHIQNIGDGSSPLTTSAKETEQSGNIFGNECKRVSKHPGLL